MKAIKVTYYLVEVTNTKHVDGKTSASKLESSVVSVTINPYIAVTGITGIPTILTVGQNYNFNPSAVVTPADAIENTIVWTVTNAGTTGATILDGVLKTTAAGIVTVLATIAKGTSASQDYTEEFTITISTFVAVTDIADVPTNTGKNMSLTLGAQ